MTDTQNVVSAEKVGARRKRRSAPPGPLKLFWRKVRAPLAESRFVADLIAATLAGVLRFIHATNRTVEGSDDLEQNYAVYAPGIAAFWHGQHLMAPCLRPKNVQMAALFSRSRDAELNARVAERFGFETVRGSGGRNEAHAAGKGGARALILLKRMLDTGRSVAMIADIPHGTPREAGLGIVMLAKFSGRPVVPVALATSRRRVIESSWDKTTVNLPFGRKAVVVGEPVHVPADASDAVLEEKRREVTASLNAATEKAYRLVDRAP
jgi:lysophospholipid acyltransferase (LPLAT)-like uncharacterized protein